MTIWLPWPPSINHYYRRVGARTLISRGGRRYRQDVSAVVLATRVQSVEGRLSVELGLHPPDRRRRDIDNVCKALLDALQHAGVYGDDSQIDRLLVQRLEPIPPGGVVVVVREVGELDEAIGGVRG